MDADELDAFWTDAKVMAGLNPTQVYSGPRALDSVLPPAWSFSADPRQADALLALVLDGVKTATASALWDYEAAGEPVPEAGQLSILLDSGEHPRALIRTSAVDVVPFSAVDAEHARREAEGDGSLSHWRIVHRRYFAENAAHGRGFTDDMPVVLERFDVLVPTGLRPDRPRIFGR